MEIVEISQGTSPVILGFPHTGTYVPAPILERLNRTGREIADTDWHIHRLYDGLLPDATTVRATFNRYVIDANRDPANVSLYPGQNTTDLIPSTDFDGLPIWMEGQEPDAGDIAARVREFHAPYHDALRAEIRRVKAIHGIAVLYDCHSIRSRIPFLFPGTLPDFNIGTNSGLSCDSRIEAAAQAVASRAEGYTYVLNGRFRGGWTTRHHSSPQEGVHTIQMELAQSTHLERESAPFTYDEGKAERLRVHLGEILRRIEALAIEIQTQNRKGTAL
jgi:formiminoglutamase